MGQQNRILPANEPVEFLKITEIKDLLKKSVPENHSILSFCPVPT